MLTISRGRLGVEKHKKDVSFTAHIRELKGSEIERYLLHDHVLMIKERDPNPYFVMLDVGHEGVSHGVQITGATKQTVNKVWDRPVVKKLADKLQGAKLFDGHDDRNNAARANVGKVLRGIDASNKKEAKARAIGYITDSDMKERITSGDIDTCSIEADVELVELGGNDWKVQDVLEVPGVALANSELSPPGFPRASVVAAIQMLAKDKEGDDDMTLEEAIKMVKEGKVKPGDLFSKKDLQGDPTVEELLKKAAEKATKDSDDKKLAEKAIKEIENLKKENEKIKAENFRLSVREKAEPKVGELLKDRKLTEKQAKGITADVLTKIGDSTDLSEDKLDDALKSAVEERIKFLQDTGAITDTDEPEGKDGDKDKTQTKPPPKDSSDYDPTNPKHNPLIPD